MTTAIERDNVKRDMHYLDQRSSFEDLAPNEWDMDYDYFFGVDASGVHRVSGYEYWCVITRKWYTVTKGLGFKMLKRKKK